MKLRFSPEGLIPVVAQDYETGEVRMLAYANEEAVKKTLETGYAHYYSRSRKKVWKKGETSGELQRVLEVRVDCDGDALIYVVRQEKDRACHTGARNCFYRTLDGREVTKPLPFEVLPRLQRKLRERISEKDPSSYTYRLASEGKERVVQKVGEEAVETLIALLKGRKEEVVHESADLLYHLLLALELSGVSVVEVLEELIKRYR